MMRTNATTTSNRYQCSNCLEWKFVSQQRQRQEGVLCARCIRKNRETKNKMLVKELGELNE